MKYSLATATALEGTFAGRLEAAHEWTVLNYIASLQARRPELGAAAIRVADGHAFFAGASPFSFAVHLGMQGAVVDSDLQLVESFYQQHGVPTKIDVTPVTHESLERLLRARDYRMADLTSVLSFDLQDGDIGSTSAEIELRWCDHDDRDTWVKMIAQYLYVVAPGDKRRKNMACMFDAPCALNVIASVDGELAGVASMMVPHDTHSNGIAVIYGSCTIPRFRRLGVHREMLRLRIETARAAGCDCVLATALPGSDSERNLERCGFRLHYVKTTWAK